MRTWLSTLWHRLWSTTIPRDEDAYAVEGITCARRKGQNFEGRFRGNGGDFRIGHAERGGRKSGGFFGG